MEAYVSGTAGQAVIISSGVIEHISVDALGNPARITKADLGKVFADARDVRRVNVATREETEELLVGSWRVDRALRMFQIAINGAEDKESRVRCANLLCDLIETGDTRIVFLNIVLSIPFPDDSDVDWVIDSSRVDARIRDLLRFIALAQEDILIVRQAWDFIPKSMFVDEAARHKAELLAVNRGVFAEIVQARRDPGKVQSAIFKAFSTLRDSPNSREIVSKWLELFKVKKINRRSKSIGREAVESADYQDEDLIRYQMTGGYESFVEVTAQKRGIVEQLERGNEINARSFAEQLVQMQLRQGGAHFASKSLCSLAQDARRLGNSQLQVEWLERSVQVAPDDAWAHGQLGDAYLAYHRFNDAHNAYLKASTFGEGRFGGAGEAKVLAATGHLDEALIVCKRVMTEFPKDRDAYKSQWLLAEIYRDMWRFEDALEAYEVGVASYPDESALRCGLAAVLADLSRLPDALSVYDDAIRKFPAEVIAWSGRAHVLNLMGRLDEAVKAYDAAIERFHNEPVPLCGKADLLRLQGRPEDSLKIYLDVKFKFSYEPAAYTGAAEAYRDIGQIEESAKIYREAKDLFPHDVHVRNGYASFLKSTGNYEEALREYDRVRAEFPYDIYGMKGRAGLLKLLGKHSDALSAYQEVLVRRPDDAWAKNSIAALYVIFGRYQEALEIIPEREIRRSSDWVSAHIRAMILLRKGETSEAIERLREGAQHAPFIDQRQFFKTSLAAALVRAGRFDDVIDIEPMDHAPILNLIRAHSFGQLGDRIAASVELMAVNDNLPPPIIELRNELIEKFVHGVREGRHSTEWIIERESEIILQAA